MSEGEYVRLLATYTLHNQKTATPKYLLRVKDRTLATVYRTGTLPSCYRWYAEITPEAKAEFEAQTGYRWMPLLSEHTRAKVVTKFLRAFANLPV